MNIDRQSANGSQLAGELKEKWAALTDDDLTRIAEKEDQLAGRLQERYGYAKEQAEREADDFLRTHPKANGGAHPGTTEPARVPTPLPPAPWEGFLPEASTPSAAPSLSPLHQPEMESRAAGYDHSLTIRISPRVLRWVAPVAVVALSVLLFFPWTGAYPGGYRVYSQNAFQTTWGGVSANPVGVEALGPVKPFDEVMANRMMLFYVLCVLLGLALVVAPLALRPARLLTLPPIVQTLWRHRLKLLAAVAVTAFLLLIIQLWIGFGLEAAANAKVDNNLARELSAAKTPEERETANIHRGVELGPFNFHRTLWLDLAVLSQVLLLAGLGLELWIKWRGTRPLPRVDWQA
jgi:uncharacterized protein YjbJ (UPF0337 family)